MLGQRARRSLESVSGNTLQIIPMPLSLMLDLKLGSTHQNPNLKYEK
jgi:hypothetical protein